MKHAGLLAGLAACTALPAHAQTGPWCGTHAYDPAHPLAWETLEPRVVPHIDALELAEAYGAIVTAFEERVALLPEAGIAVDDVRDALYFYERLVTDTGREAPAIWRGNLPPGGEMLLYDLARIAPGDPAAERTVAVPCTAFAPERGDSVARSFAYLARTLLRAGTHRDLAIARRGGAIVASTAYRTYEDLLHEGLPMWPWELKVNETFMPETLDSRAPDRQLTVMRPNLAVGLVFDGDESSAADYALTLEPIGFVRYRADDYTRWWGASLLVTMTGDNGRGYGAMFRWNDFTLGIARHERSIGDDERMLFVSVDLYRHILGEDGRTATAEGFLSALRERLEARAGD